MVLKCFLELNYGIMIHRRSFDSHVEMQECVTSQKIVSNCVDTLVHEPVQARAHGKAVLLDNF